ncbi:hypothetical protein GCM10017709_01470 [Glutamicibacter nicotianae]
MAAAPAIRMFQVRGLKLRLLHGDSGLSPADGLSPILAILDAARVIIKKAFGASSPQCAGTWHGFAKSDGFLKLVHCMPILA